MNILKFRFSLNCETKIIFTYFYAKFCPAMQFWFQIHRLNSDIRFTLTLELRKNLTEYVP